MTWPTNQKIITQHFGENPEYYKFYGFPGHEGVDIAASYGTPYHAVLDGVVVWASDQRLRGGPSAYGYHVIVDHGDMSTLYGHALPQMLVKVGDHVKAGDKLTLSGNTGNSTGYHLHLTLKIYGYQLEGWPAEYADPYDYLKHLM